jgi:hypothetical protein
MCRTCVERVIALAATYWMQRSALDWKIMKFQKGKSIWNLESVFAKRQRVQNFAQVYLLEPDVKVGM